MSDIKKIIEGKVIFPVVNEIRFHSYKLDDKSDNLDKRIQPITREDVAELATCGYDCPRITNEGVVLMRHPYLPNKIVPFSSNTGDFIYEKLQHYSSILNLLGAKKQELCAICEDLKERTISGDGKVSVKGFRFSGSFKKEQFNKNYSKRTVSIEGNSPVWSYDKALTLAKEYGLEDDPFIKSMLAKRRYRPIDHYKEREEISREFNTIMDIAANMNIMGAAFNLDGNFKEELKVVQKVFIDQDIVFVGA